MSKILTKTLNNAIIGSFSLKEPMTSPYYNVFLPTLQKYLHVHSLNLIRYFSKPSNIKTYFVLNEGEKSSLINGTYEHIVLLKNLVQQKKAPDEKKQEALRLLDSIQNTSIVEVSFMKNLTFFTLKNSSISTLEQSITDSKSIIDNFNKTVSSINSLLIDIFGQEKSIIAQSESYERNYYHSVNSKTIKKDIPCGINDFFIPYYTLTNTQKSNIKKALTLIPDILKHCITREEYEAKTDNSYIVYCRDGDREGFLNKNSFYAPFNQAESFPDVAKAKRACSARGVPNYEIFPVSAQLGQSFYQTEKLIRGNTINSILTWQEKELVKAVMHSNYVQELEEKIKNYEAMLVSHNLLEVKDQKPKKVNKL